MPEPSVEKRPGVRIERALPLVSRALGIIGRADIVEFRADSSRSTQGPQSSDQEGAESGEGIPASGVREGIPAPALADKPPVAPDDSSCAPQPAGPTDCGSAATDRGYKPLLRVLKGSRGGEPLLRALKGSRGGEPLLRALKGSRGGKPLLRALKGSRGYKPLLQGGDDASEPEPRSVTAEVPYPIDYKHGPKRKWDNDDVQLCAQAMCLEEMLGVAVPAGAIFHATSKRRREVVFTGALRDQVRRAAAELHALMRRTEPPPTGLRPQCEGCSMHRHCLPEAGEAAERIRDCLRALFAS